MTTSKIMEQAQVFASSWALVGSRFDSGFEIANAHEQKADLQTMVEELAKERDEYRDAADTMAAAHKVERDALSADAELYRHLRDHFAKTATDAKAEFARLEPLTGDAFDSVVRASMDAMGVSA